MLMRIDGANGKDSSMYVLNYLINSPLSLSMYFSVQVSIHSTLSMCVINTYTFIFPSYSTHLYIVISIGSYTRKEREEDPFGEGEKERSDAIRWCHECHNTCTMRMAIVVISMSNWNNTAALHTSIHTYINIYKRVHIHTNIYTYVHIH